MNNPFELSEADELERKAKEIRRREHAKKMEEHRVKVEEFEKKNKFDIYIANDYCGMRVGGLHFYYGYEETECPKHKNDDCEDDGCEKREWCFAARKNQKDIMRLRTSKLHPEEGNDVWFYLLCGIAMYLKKK